MSAAIPLASNLEAAPSQMAFTLGFHSILASLGVAFPAIMLIGTYRGLRHDDADALLLARRWSKVVAVTFAVGAVTGTVLSFELGLLWPALFFVLFLVVRGTPAIVLYRGVLPLREHRLALAFFTATQLPLVVAIKTVAVDAGEMRASTAAALVGAGAPSTLAGPLHGLRMRRIAALKHAGPPRACRRTRWRSRHDGRGAGRHVHPT